MDKRITTAGIIEHNDKVLLLKKRPDSSIGSVWEFPGGKSRDNESPAEALIRECKEELHLQIAPGQEVMEHHFTNKGTHYELKVFTVASFSGDITITEDHTDFRWIPKSELENLPMSQSDRKISSFILLNTR